ncbi:MAG: hypothetical protein ACI9QL_005156 [Candidatus Omnitrophota bacterium]|jgi:hypothetical protein
MGMVFTNLEMLMKRLLFIISFLLFGTISLCNATLILFAGSTAGTPTSGADPAVFTFLEGRYGAANVTYMQTSAVTPLVAEGFDGVVVSSTPGSGDIRNKFPNMNVGLINWEEAVMDSGGGEFGMSTVLMTKSTTTTMLSLAPHPITAGLPSSITFATAGETLNSASLFTGITSIATALDGTGVGNSALFIAEAGDAVNPLAGTSGNIAPARRVMFPITDNTFNTLTPEGLQLFGQAVDWIANVDMIPEPGSGGLLVLGGLVVGVCRRLRG